jgi:glucose-1-phosphate thymidylyltransferase
VKALIPVAGVGTRLRPHTHTVPKALLNVAGKPILGHIIDLLLEAGIDEFCFVVGHMGEYIREWGERTYRVPMHWVEQKQQLGLGHAVRETRRVIRDDPVFIVLGDTLFDADLKGVIARGGNSLGVMEVTDPSRFGVVVVEGGRVVRLVEKPAEPISCLAIAGLYHIQETKLLFRCLDRLVKEEIRTKGEYQLTDALGLMIREGAIFRTFPLGGWYDCGLPETILETNRILLDQLPPGPLPQTDPEAVVIPPVAFGREVRIERSVVGPHVSLEDGVIIRGSVVRNSILGEGARVEEAVLDGSIVGAGALVRGRPMSLNVGDSSEIDFGKCDRAEERS